MKFSEQELQKRYAALRDAIANQRLEGLEVDPRTIKDLYKEARGEITLEEALARVYKRIENGEL